MILNGNMLCTRCDFWIVSHGNAGLIASQTFRTNFGFGRYKRKITFISCIKLVIGKVSLRACNKAIYSASAVDKAIFVCSLLYQNIIHPA
jgi:hypothetical protein